MQTDPEHRDYKITEGGRRKVEGWTPELQLSEQIMDDDARVEMRADPFKKLEHLTKDKVHSALHLAADSWRLIHFPIPRRYSSKRRTISPI